MNPKILIAGPEDKADYFKPYIEAVRLAGGDPELGLPDPEIAAYPNSLFFFLNCYGGILLPGGKDIDPKFYGEPRHPTTNPADPDLDIGQLAVAKMLIEESIPALAICRGLQVVTVAAGEKLVQDLPSQWESGIKVDHRVDEPKDRLVHAVEADPDSRLAEICGELRFEVNSRHHQAAREGATAGRIGPFRIVARAPDGVIEGFELPGHPFFIAIQWHPENLVETHPPSRNLMGEFINKANQRE